MTEKQHRWYLREWSSAFRVHWCGSKGGEALARPNRPACAMRERVIAEARKLAATREDGRMSADLLRRACHVVATGKDLSSYALANKQIDQVVAVFRVLARDRDVVAQMRVDAADVERARLAQAGRAADAGQAIAPSVAAPDADRNRMIYSISHSDLSAAYIAELARDKFGTAEWKGLPDEKLRQLLITVKCRAAARAIGSKLRSTPIDRAMAPR